MEPETQKLIVYLYSSPQCELCHHALEVLNASMNDLRLPNNALQIDIQEIDITSNFELKKRYGWTIPVLGSNQSELELNWPFDSAQCSAFLIQLANDSKH